MVAVYRWGSRDVVLICPEQDARQLIPGTWHGRYVAVLITGPDAPLWRLMGYGGDSTAAVLGREDKLSAASPSRSPEP